MAINKILNNISADMSYGQIVDRIIGLAISAGFPATNPTTVVLDIDTRARSAGGVSATSVTAIVGTVQPSTPMPIGTLWVDMDSTSATYRTILINAVASPSAPIFYSISSVTGIINPILGVRTVIGVSKATADTGSLSGGGGGGGGVTAHGALTGLANDDHTQYLNSTRGDARYAAFGSDAFLRAFGATPDTMLTGTRSLNADDVVTTSPVTWPDGTAGVFTATSINATFKCVDAYTVTYVGSTTKTVTQAAMTRNANGEITVRPPLTIS